MNVLFNTSVRYIPRFNTTCLKTWWSSELNELKEAAMKSHKLWCDAGKPRYGVIFDNRTKDKNTYKLKIRNLKKAENDVISDKLMNLLTEKRGTAFWKPGKAKFANRKNYK